MVSDQLPVKCACPPVFGIRSFRCLTHCLCVLCETESDHTDGGEGVLETGQ